MKKIHIKKGDTVYVNAGNDKGKTGKVLSVIPEKDRVVVEGVNMVSKHTKPNSNVNLVVDGKPTRVGYKFVDGKKVRYAKKSGEEI